MKSPHQHRVEHFMMRGGQDVPALPTIPDEQSRILRARLIMEEALETIGALGVCVGHKDAALDMQTLLFDTCSEPDLEKIIDGCCDIKVVTTGTLSACGVPDDPFQEEVDQNNLWKVKDGVKKSPEGKILKPEGWRPPRIAELLHLVKTQYQDRL